MVTEISNGTPQFSLIVDTDAVSWI